MKFTTKMRISTTTKRS